MRQLSGIPQRQPLFDLVEPCHQPTRLDRMAAALVQAKLLGQYMCCRRKRTLNVAVIDLGLSHQIIGKADPRTRRVGSEALDRIDQWTKQNL